MAKPVRAYSRRKKILLLFCALVVAILVLIAGLPLWFPWVLKPVLQSQGVRYSSYERKGYTHFVLRNVTYAKKGTSFSAKQVQAQLPTALVWEKAFGTTGGNAVVAQDWLLVTRPGDKPRADKSVTTVVNKTESVLAVLRKWVANATLKNGAMELNRTKILVPSAIWSRGVLKAHIGLPGQNQKARLKADLRLSLPWTASLKLETLGAVGTFSLDRTPLPSPSGLKFRGALDWQTNRAHFSALFAPGRALPEEASVEVDSFQFPAELLELEGYRTVEGSLHGDWKSGRFHVDLSANATPLEVDNPTNAPSLGSWPSPDFPPVHAILRAGGDTNSLEIETVDIVTPWLEARLQGSVRMAYTGQMLSDVARFEVKANLDKQKWLPLTGELEGEALLKREANNLPDVVFTLSGRRISGYSVALNQATVKGELLWPMLFVDSLDVEFANGATTKAGAVLDLNQRFITKGSLQFHGPFAEHLLPAGYSYADASGTIEVSGSWKKPEHSGQLHVRGLNTPRLTALDAEASWKGRQLDISGFKVSGVWVGKTGVAAPGDGRTPMLTVEGAAALGSPRKEITLNTFTLGLSGESFALTRPAALSFKKESRGWNIQLEPFQWRNGRSELAIAANIGWPRHGAISGSVREIALPVFQELFKKTLPPANINQLDLSAGWSNGPVQFSLSLIARSETNAPVQGFPFAAQIEAFGNSSGITLNRLSVISQKSPVADGSGFLPITFWPGREANALQIDTNGPIRLSMTTVPDPYFWNSITAKSRVAIEEPSVKLSVNGSLLEPKGTLEVGLQRARIKPKANLPELVAQNVRARVELSKEAIILQELRFSAQGQPVTARGRAPVPKRYSEWRQILDWRKASGRVDIQKAELAPFAQFATNYIAPQGLFSLHMSSQNGSLSGELEVEHAASPPIKSLGVFSGIQARLRLAGDQIQVVSASGLLGGAPVAAAGRVNWRKREPASKLPYFDLKVRGDTFPLVRGADLIVRSDFDLRVSNLSGGPAVISGTATLRDSYFLSDIRLLVPPKLPTPKTRPPYFNVEQEPWAAWRLDVGVSGTNFLKVQSPFFTGTVTANLRLSGPLRAPVALGDLRINSGRIRFPFGSMQLQQGEVSLTSADPFRPHVFITGATRAYNYDIRMQATGPADDVNLEFTSMPSLSSHQILQMLTTGELPPSQSQFSTQQKAGRVAIFVGRTFLSRIGLFEASDERLTISSSESLVEPGVQSYSSEYKVNEEWSVIGDYDSYSGLNLGMKWRFYSK